MTARHLAWLRQQPCVVQGCLGQPVEAHHVRTAANAGMGMKPDDREAVPTCHAHHMAIHSHGWLTFETTYGLDLRAEARRYAASSGTELMF